MANFLQKQIHCYSINTNFFMFDDEKKISNEIMFLKLCKSGYIPKNEVIETYKELYPDTFNECLKLKKMKAIKTKLIKCKANKKEDELYHLFLQFNNMINFQIENLKNSVSNKRIEELQSNLKELINTNNETDNVRKINQAFVPADRISIFESNLSRTLNIETGEETDDIIIIRVYHYAIFESIATKGFFYNKRKYIMFSASSGQIRNKQVVFMAAKVYKKNKKKIMCGLTIKKINKKEINLNKFLAYTSLVSTASEKWEGFDIEKAIVVEDFNTIVNSVFDYIDYDKYDDDGLWKVIEKVEKSVEIPTMDGCGICTDYTGMIRLPFIKGLMVEFPIKQFIEEARVNEKKEKGNYYTKIGKVYDIYKKEEIDILEKDIKYIFTRSQFKMWKYYSDWNKYKKFFKDLGCEACKCKDEDEEFYEGKMSYQPFQTLYDLTDEELTELLADTNNSIDTIGDSRQNMLKVLGATMNNPKKNYFQQALEIYPEMLNDNYSQKLLKEVKKSMITNVKSGKIKVDSVYTFVLPDVYAFAEWLFLPHDKEDENRPTGLLKRGEVSCNLFKDGVKLDLVRSPHLNFEHCININVNNEEIKKWYKSNGVYVSIDSTDSRELSFDHDGDEVLVIREPLIIKAVERIRKNLDVVPLYYEMKKGKDGIITEQNLYNAMIEAYKGGKIGQISNAISKIWNSGEITKDKLKAIKYLAFFNNCQIDYAKSHWLPDRKENMQEFLTQFTGDKLPYFFQFLKGKNKGKNKSKKEVAEINNSVVNRMGKLVTKKNFSFKADNCGDFDYKILLHNKNIDIETDKAKEIISTFINLNSNKKFYSNAETVEEHNYTPVYISKKIDEISKDKIYVVDLLVKYHFEENKENKRTLWQVYGDTILENIKANLPSNTILCEKCGKRVHKTNNRMKYCHECAEEINREKAKNNRLKSVV